MMHIRPDKSYYIQAHPKETELWAGIFWLSVSHARQATSLNMQMKSLLFEPHTVVYLHRFSHYPTT